MKSSVLSTYHIDLSEATFALDLLSSCVRISNERGSYYKLSQCNRLPVLAQLCTQSRNLEVSSFCHHL